MKNLVVGVLVAFGLAACSDSEGGGTGGAGGIQGPEGTTTSTGVQGAGGGSCAISGDGTALCAALEECEPGKGVECAAELEQDRCADPTCTGVYDTWVGCFKALADAGDIPECADYPVECDAQRTAYEECI